jgi:hypothetical protein
LPWVPAVLPAARVTNAQNIRRAAEPVFKGCDGSLNLNDCGLISRQPAAPLIGYEIFELDDARVVAERDELRPVRTSLDLPLCYMQQTASAQTQGTGSS